MKNHRFRKYQKRFWKYLAIFFLFLCFATTSTFAYVCDSSSWLLEAFIIENHSIFENSEYILLITCKGLRVYSKIFSQWMDNNYKNSFSHNPLLGDSDHPISEIFGIRNLLWLRYVGDKEPWGELTFLFGGGLGIPTKKGTRFKRHYCIPYRTTMWCFATFGEVPTAMFEEIPPTGNQYKEHILSANPFKSWVPSYYPSIMAVDDKSIWFLEGKNLWKVDRTTTEANLVFTAKTDNLRNIKNDRDFIWISDLLQLYQINKSSQSVETFTPGVSHIMLKKVTNNSVWSELWNSGCDFDYERDFVGLARLDKQSKKWKTYLLNEKSGFVYLNDVDDEDNLWVAKAEAKPILSSDWSAHIVSLMKYDREHGLVEYPVGKNITPWVGLISRKGGAALKVSKDFVWITAINAILKFDKKTKKWFYKSLD